MSQRVDEQIGILAAIESEAHFLKVRLKMLRADFVPSAHDAALEKRESGFNGVRVRIATNVITNSMLDGFVLQAQAFCDSGIHVSFVGKHYLDILSNIFPEKIFDGLSRDVLSMKESKFAVTLANADYRALLSTATALISSASLAAYIRLVYFDLAVKHRLVTLGHRCADSVAEIPGSLVAAHSYRALNLARTHALFRLTKENRCQKPFRQRKMRVVENSPGGYAELIAAFGTLKFVLREKARNCLALATRAYDTFGPAESLEKLSAFFFRTKLLINLREVHSHGS